MSDNPLVPPDGPLPSIWTRVFKPLRVAITGLVAGDLQVGVTVPVTIEDLRPKPTYGQVTCAAARNIRSCEKLFDGWMTGLDNSEKPNEREQELRFHLECLKEDAEWCSNAINKILQHHVRFASLVAQRIENASKSQYDLKHDDSETTKITNDIREVSHSLSINVTDMEYDLESFVSALEDVRVVVKERSLAEKLREWLKYLLIVIAAIVAAVCFLISTCLSCVEPKPQYLTSAVSTLGKAAAKVYRVDSENESESLDLRGVQNAQKKLKEFDEALNIMGLAGQRETLYGPDLAAVAEEWRDLAKQYQSMLPVDDDPAC